MVSALALRMVAEPLRSLAFGAIGAGYTGIGTSFANPIRILFVQNLTNDSLLFSLDGVHDHFPLAGGSFMLLDVTANQAFNQGCFFAQGQRVYVKLLGAPSSGSVYVSVFYAATGY